MSIASREHISEHMSETDSIAVSRNLVNDFVCTNIRRLRMRKGLRLRDVSRRSGIALGSYSCIETGRYRLNLENLYRILHALDADIRDVWPQAFGRSREAFDETALRATLDEAAANRPALPSLDDVISAVCQAFDVTRDELQSGDRRRRFSDARAAAAFVTSRLHHLTLVALSKTLKRDVSSLSHQLRRFRNRLDNEVLLAEKVGKAFREIEG